MAGQRISRRQFVRTTGTAAALALSGSPLSAAGAARRRPNIVYLCSDQQHWQALGFVDTFFDTPHSDGLAAESVVFDHAFCTTPQCSPSRSSMLTGFYPHHTGMMNNTGAAGGSNLNMRTIGAMLQSGGYHTGYFGKWHLGNDPVGNAGWDERFKRGPDRKMTEQGIEFIGRHAGDEKPFALFLMYVDPHDIYHFRPGVKDVSELDIPLSESWHRENLDTKPKVQKQFMTDNQGRIIWNRPQEIWEEYRDFYRRKVRLYDEHVGKVLSALKENGLWDSTIVMSTSDHGDMDTNHRLIFKGPFMYEHMMRIPMMIRVPAACGGIAPRRVADYDWVNVDTVPTLLDLAGLPPVDCHATSAKPLLTGQGTPSPRPYVIGQYYGKQTWVNPIRTIRTHELKYNVYIDHGEELVDLVNDPHELVNLAEDAKYRGRKRELAAELANWMARHDDRFHSFKTTPLAGPGPRRTRRVPANPPANR